MSRIPHAGVILIGDELLNGSVQDENLPYIAKNLAKRGIRIHESRIVTDDIDAIATAVNDLRQQLDYVFTTGGIGPTHDDITSAAVSHAFGLENVVQADVLASIEKHHLNRDLEMTAAAARMALAPEGAEIIHTDNLVIPGYRIDNVYVMAGVPRIMQIMLASILPMLEQTSELNSREVHVNALETDVAEELGLLQKQFDEVSIGSYPQERESDRSDFRLVIHVEGENLAITKKVTQEIANMCLQKDLVHSVIAS